MRRYFRLIVLLALIGGIPKFINYQGKLLDSSGVGVNGVMEMTFRLYNSDTGGTILWEEGRNINVVNGLFSVVLGEITGFDTLDFNTPYWLEISVNGEVLSPREKFTAVPYAFRADIANNISKLTMDSTF
ncbi:MAG: hypothetical protein ACPL6C_02575, partial [bacterium]